MFTCLVALPTCYSVLIRSHMHTHTHTHTHTQACFPNLYLHSAPFLTASFTHLQCICTHLAFYLCQQIPGPSAPCWALNSCVSLHGEPPRCASPSQHTHKRTAVAGETHRQPHPGVNLSLFPRQLNTSQCKYICKKSLFIPSVEARRLCVLAVSRPESGHSFPRQGHRDLALRLHHSACPPGATWPDCSSTPPHPSYAWICIKQRHGSACNVCHS